MQIHMALSERPRWVGDERLGETAIVHVTPGLDGVSRAVNEAERGLLPAEATIVVGQPLAVDPSRAPDDASILWIQLQELPSRVKGDAAGEHRRRRRDVDGGAPRALRRPDPGPARRHVPNLDSALLRRVVLSPADIEAANVNMVGGDIYSGSCALDQNLLWRPEREPARASHRDPGPLPDRREHPSRARARRRLGNARREGATALRARRPRPHRGRVRPRRRRDAGRRPGCSGKLIDHRYYLELWTRA